MEFSGPGLLIKGNEPYRRAAALLEIEYAAIRAVAEVESRNKPFLKDGRPVILYERHVFSRRTDRRFDATHRDISNPDPGGYGAGGEHQYTRLHRAIELDRKAALESASWGAFQIMGFNAVSLGYADVEAFVALMVEHHANHLDGFCRFIKVNNLAKHLTSPSTDPESWRAFASRYNGPAYEKNRYHEKMARAYGVWIGREGQPAPPPSGPTAPVPPARPPAPPSAPAQRFRVITVAHVQYALNRLAGGRLAVDGIMGPKTAEAIKGFEKAVALPTTGTANATTRAAIQSAYYALQYHKEPVA